MWLPRLKVHVSPPPAHLEIHFEGGFGLFSLCSGSLDQFFGAKVQFHLCFSQVQRAKAQPEGCCPTRHPATLRVTKKSKSSILSCMKWAPKALQGGHPLPSAPMPWDGLYAKHKGCLRASPRARVPSPSV